MYVTVFKDKTVNKHNRKEFNIKDKLVMLEALETGISPSLDENV